MATDAETWMKDARTFQEMEVRRSKRVSVGALVAAGVSGTMCMGLAYALAFAVPNIRVQPVYMIARQDGTFDVVNKQWELPGTLTEAQKRSFLFQYVVWRESYNRFTAKDNYELVNSYSSPAVAQRFSDYWNDKIPGAPSPSKVMGREGAIRVAFRDSELSGDTFQVRYCRSVKLEGQAEQIQPMIARLTFQTIDTVPLLQRFQYNPNALIVTSYQAPIQQGGGAAGDCAPMGGF